MGYAVYEDRTARDYGVDRWAGYGVPAICDVADCKCQINRGIGYRCEDYTAWQYLLDDEQVSAEEEWDEEREVEMPGCGLHFCSEHLDHNSHGDHATPKPDTGEWVRHMLTDESWEQWREENQTRVIDMRAAVVTEQGEKP